MYAALKRSRRNHSLRRPPPGSSFDNLIFNPAKSDLDPVRLTAPKPPKQKKLTEKVCQRKKDWEELSSFASRTFVFAFVANAGLSSTGLSPILRNDKRQLICLTFSTGIGTRKGPTHGMRFARKSVLANMSRFIWGLRLGLSSRSML